MNNKKYICMHMCNCFTLQVVMFIKASNQSLMLLGVHAVAPPQAALGTAQTDYNSSSLEKEACD